MSSVSQRDRTQLLHLLTKLPEMATERSRRHFLTHAGLEELAARVDLSGSPEIAAGEIVIHLLKSGKTGDWVMFLTAACKLVGAKQQVFLEKLATKTPAIASTSPVLFQHASKALSQVNRHRKKVAIAGAIGGVALGAIVFFVAPYLSDRLFRAAIARFNEKDLEGTRKRLEWAIALDPGNIAARYNLALLYENLDRSELAREKYRQLLEEVPAAYNNLARLYIHEQKYAEATALLLRGLQQGGNDLPSRVKYNFHKNLGWAYFEQDRYREAERELGIAIAILDRLSPEEWKNTSQKASAYCLQAQVLERKEDGESLQKSLNMWENCCQLGSRRNADEEPWLGMANERARGSEGKISCKAKSSPKP